MNPPRPFLGRTPTAIVSDPEAQRRRSFIAGYQIPAPLRYCARGTVASLSFTSPTQPAVDQYFAAPQPTLHPAPPPSHATEPENRSATDAVRACRRFYVAGIVVALVGVAFVFATAMYSRSHHP